MFFLHLLVLSLLCSASGKVVQDFESECGQYFANRKPPTTFLDPQYRQICQRLNNVDFFASFYDTYNKIPVYSAYKFEGLKNCNRKNVWYIEPQVDDNNTKSNMATECSVHIDTLGDLQALNEDYYRSGYDRGHLAPVYHASSESCADASFTLTNAAPQNPSFNKGQWRVLERNIATFLQSECKSYTNYIVTGVVPGTNKINNRVTVPSHFWTAYCCLDNNHKCQISEGFIGENENITPSNKTVRDLEEELANLYGVTSFKLFTEPRGKKNIRNPKSILKYTFKTTLY